MTFKYEISFSIVFYHLCDMQKSELHKCCPWMLSPYDTVHWINIALQNSMSFHTEETVASLIGEDIYSSTKAA
ncbi:hypothetical protein VTP01DRAFT_1158 [Rhizomucor pusillus]|uniref:uncharacterized protein n=1 Tax=Rhizomucor pusillus TaxID=4840 RepID=UPI00374477D7